MPIFMDRHDLRGAKAEDVAAAHRRDVDIQDRHGVKYMAYWFDQERGAAFCLVHAPDAATAELVHREAHGEIANPLFRSILPRLRPFSAASAIRAPPRGLRSRPWIPGCAPSCSPTSSVR